MGQSQQVYHHRSFSRWSQQPALFLYTEARHLKLQTTTGWHFFELKNASSMVARMAIHVSGKIATSPFKAPFGSFEIHGSVTEEQLRDFLESILTTLGKQGVQELTIKNFPDRYDQRNARKIRAASSRLGFTMQNEIDSLILVTNTPFERIIKISERQKLKKAQKVFAFSQVERREYKRLYAFIEQCRHKRGQSLSMTAASLEKLVATFPDRFYFFEVSTEQDTAAAAIVIRVSTKILYTFYYAHDSRFNRISPTVLLLSGIYLFARTGKFNKIDLGTSMLDGKVNRSLLHFKRSVGGISNDRLIFNKHLS